VDGFEPFGMANLVPESVAHIEHVDCALAVSRHHGRRDRKTRLEERVGHLIEQTRTVQALDLDDCRACRRLIVEVDPGRDAKGGGAAPGRTLGNGAARIDFATQRSFDRLTQALDPR